MVKEKNVGTGEMDKRFLDRRLMRGEITEGQLEEYLATLPDMSGNKEEIIVVMEGKSGASKREADAD